MVTLRPNYVRMSLDDDTLAAVSTFSLIKVGWPRQQRAQLLTQRDYDSKCFRPKESANVSLATTPKIVTLL